MPLALPISNSWQSRRGALGLGVAVALTVHLLVLFGVRFHSHDAHFHHHDHVEVTLVVAAPMPKPLPPTAPVETAQPPPAPAKIIETPPPPVEPKPVELKPAEPSVLAPPEKIEPPPVEVKTEVALVPRPLTPLPTNPATNAASPSEEVVVVKGKPNYRRSSKPIYPPLARRRGMQGAVLLLVAVDTEGKPAQVELKQSSGFTLLDEAAIKAVREWEFEPERINGRPVRTQVEVPVRFTLSN